MGYGIVKRGVVPSEYGFNFGNVNREHDLIRIIISGEFSNKLDHIKCVLSTPISARYFSLNPVEPLSPRKIGEVLFSYKLWNI
jgi:hypothetical protein